MDLMGATHRVCLMVSEMLYFHLSQGRPPVTNTVEGELKPLSRWYNILKMSKHTDESNAWTGYQKGMILMNGWNDFEGLLISSASDGLRSVPDMRRGKDNV